MDSGTVFLSDVRGLIRPDSGTLIYGYQSLNSAGLLSTAEIKVFVVQFVCNKEKSYKNRME